MRFSRIVVSDVGEFHLNFWEKEFRVTRNRHEGVQKCNYSFALNLIEQNEVDRV